ncbi:MAG: hypothetical protein JNL97_10995, partial [Verrucomicrobiales bacterium]|nr:hypothetical protein [Verrucomicrobiales bacterium]
MTTAYRIRHLMGSLIALILVLACLGFLFARAWTVLGPRKVEPSEVRKRLVAEWVPEALQDIRTHRPGLTKAAVLHFADDPTDYVTDRLREGIRDSGYLNVVEPGLDEKVPRLLNLEVDSPSSLADAFEQARRFGVPYLIYGRVLAFEGTSMGAQLMVELSLAHVSSRNVAFQRTYIRNWDPPEIEPGIVTYGPSNRYAGRRLLLWALGVLLLPVATIPFLRATVRRSSNGANLAALAVYTVADTLLAFLLLGLE